MLLSGNLINDLIVICTSFEVFLHLVVGFSKHCSWNSLLLILLFKNMRKP